MIVKDMMPGFELYQPASLRDALELADRFGTDGWVMAGGNDSLAWFKDRAKRPQAVIDITGIAELKGVRETADGVEIGDGWQAAAGCLLHRDRQRLRRRSPPSPRSSGTR